MNERIVTFGLRNELVGILTTPESALDLQRPIVLMWNVGVNHRVGPFRFNVDLARHLAAKGFATYRFDKSGLGDSDFRREAVPEAESEALDVTEAMDVVTRRTSAEQFVLVGYCSSVDAAHQVTMVDPRVVGAVHIEGYAYPTPGSRRRARRNLLSWSRWDRAVRRRCVRILRRRKSSSTSDVAGSIYSRRIPTQEQFAADLATLSGELAKPHLFIYSSSLNGAEQFSEMFDHPDIDHSRIVFEHYADADHTFYTVDHREMVIRSVAEWLANAFPRDVHGLGGCQMNDGAGLA